MSKEGRTYAVVKWNPGFDRAKFNRAKAQGLIQTSFDSVFVFPGGTTAALKWRGNRPAEINQGLVIFEGDLAGYHAYVQANGLLNTSGPHPGK